MLAKRAAMPENAARVVGCRSGARVLREVTEAAAGRPTDAPN
jgi:hypothetical protein